MRTMDEQVEVMERQDEAGETATDQAQKATQRAVIRAWVLLLTNQAEVNDIMGGFDPRNPIDDTTAVRMATALGGQEPPPDEVTNLVKFAVASSQNPADAVFLGGPPRLRVFDALRATFQQVAAEAWAGGGAHPGRAELDDLLK